MKIDDFAGVGVAKTWIRSRYTMVYQSPGHDLPDYGRSKSDTAWELHLGYTSPRLPALGGLALQVLIVASETGDFHSRRFALGVEY